MVEVNFNVWGNGSINRSGHITSDAPTYVVIHGYQSTGGNAGNNYKAADWMENIAQTIRERESNANIILLDWEEGASSLWYPTSATRTRDVGNQLATYLINNGVDPTYINLIGHSLGAHIAGFTGSTYRESIGRSLAQIVGLDPAGPEFEGKAASDRLDATDANRVVSLHTSESLGYDSQLATLDVYANWNDLFQPGQWNFAGNHGYANILYTELLQGNSFTQSNGILLNLNTIVNAEFTGYNDASTKSNLAIVALNLLGTANNDTQAGGAANDIIRGNAGIDYITGGDGDDSVFGDDDNDLLYGGRGNDSAFGGTGSDRLFGDEGGDILIGTDTTTRGIAEVDLLTGGAGSDQFVLGITVGVFYSDSNTSTSGLGDYALIADFNATEDTLQLSGSNSSYSLGAAPTGLATGTALFLNETSPELIAIIQGSSNLTLSASYFLTV
ncbi:alpha/beta hydrolase family protein [Nostoc sp. FACHB-892]